MTRGYHFAHRSRMMPGELSPARAAPEGSTMKRLATVLAGLWVIMAFVTTPISHAAANHGDTSFPIDDVTQLEMHVHLDCQLATKECDFDTQADLRTPDGVTGFPADLWARQSTETRSSDRLAYLVPHINGGFFTKVFKEGGPNVITTIYFGDGPLDKYSINGSVNPVSWATGQPKTDSDVIVCAHIQVVYSGVNIESPDTCAQTTFS
jgi:hypothetical protein